MEKKVNKTIEWDDLPEEKQAAINIYYHLLLKKHPQWDVNKLLRKTGEYFDMKFEVTKDFINKRPLTDVQNGKG